MPSDPPDSFVALLDEKLADSLVAPLPDVPPRRVADPLQLPGKATAVVGVRRAGKTTFSSTSSGASGWPPAPIAPSCPM